MTLHRKSRRGNGILFRYGSLKTASFRRKMRSRRTKDCEKQGFGGQRHQQADAQKGTGVPCLRVYDGTEKTKRNRLVWGEEFFHFG